ncbi:hypothetical protein EDB85DRAFT_1983078 [Lactarius pseudohatsudake]|nr:hypothetical protein EDB85DRAFT_1983078 [Lactarius pseudohatsudake]
MSVSVMCAPAPIAHPILSFPHLIRPPAARERGMQAGMRKRRPPHPHCQSPTLCAPPLIAWWAYAPRPLFSPASQLSLLQLPQSGVARKRRSHAPSHPSPLPRLIRVRAPSRCALPPACSHPPTSMWSPFTTRRRAETGVAGDGLGMHERDGGGAAPVAPFAESGARSRSGRRAEVRAARHSSWRGAPPQPSLAWEWGTRMGAPRGNGAPSPLRATRQHERSAHAQVRCPLPPIPHASRKGSTLSGGLRANPVEARPPPFAPPRLRSRGRARPGDRESGKGHALPLPPLFALEGHANRVPHATREAALPPGSHTGRHANGAARE